MHLELKEVPKKLVNHGRWYHRFGDGYRIPRAGFRELMWLKCSTKSFLAADKDVGKVLYQTYRAKIQVNA